MSSKSLGLRLFVLDALTRTPGEKASCAEKEEIRNKSQPEYYSYNAVIKETGPNSWKDFNKNTLIRNCCRCLQSSNHFM